ncbi:DUF4951 domain-containing protein [Sorangium sp. So ce118]
MQEIHFPGSGEEIVSYGYDHGGSVVSVVGENQQVNPQHPDEPVTTEYLRHIGYDEFGQRVRVVAGKGGLQRAGVTRDIAETWAKFHRNEVVCNPANPSAQGRAELMEAAAKVLR